MKKIIYLLLLLVFVMLITGAAVFGHPENMSAGALWGIAAALIVYAAILLLVREDRPAAAEGQALPPAAAASDTAVLAAGTAAVTLAVLYQLLTRNVIDYWLLAALIVMNLAKIVSFVYLENKQ